MATKSENNYGKWQGLYVSRTLNKGVRALQMPVSCTGYYDVYLDAKSGIITAIPKGEKPQPEPVKP